MKTQRVRRPARGPKRKPLIRRARAVKKKGRRKIKLPNIPLKSRGWPPSYFKLLQDAVLTLKDYSGKGASLPQIRRHLQSKYRGRFDMASDKLLTAALQRLANRGKVICKSGHKYKFNAPKVPRKRLYPESSMLASTHASTYTGTDQSGPSQSRTSRSGACSSQSARSFPSEASSFTTTDRSGASTAKQNTQNKGDDKVAEGDQVRSNSTGGKAADDEAKTSTGEPSSSDPSASPTASPASSRGR